MIPRSGRSSAWRHALATLAAPAHWVHVTAGDSDEVQTVRYYVGDAGTVAHIIDDERHEISFPVKIEDSLERGRQMDGMAVVSAIATPFSVDLRCEELTALAGATDVLREDQMRSALERRRPDSSYRFPTDRLAAEIESGRISPPGRWLTEMLAALPARYAPHSKSLPAGLESLTQRTWLNVVGREVSLAAPMPGICLELGSQTPYLLIGVWSLAWSLERT